ncbi:MAG: amidohydrolase [Nitrososphaerota archaeon]|nr:amidohydrolase [Nitrososphaerota archaeon]MDG6938917.1 amidohydrolase [Nitrososphaerota archaeon]
MLNARAFMKDVKKYEPEIIKIRRDVHENPELAYKEFRTSKLVADRLRGLGIKATSGVGGTGVVGLLEGGKEGRVVALRADMDALPIQENADVEFRSKVDNAMHACGHDTHVSMLLGAAMLLAGRRDELAGTVKFLFQPAEEHGGRGGAKPMIEDGAMKNPKVDYVFGLHIMNGAPAGTFALRPGAMMAAPDSFKVRIVGRGGHGSEPHKTVDPIFVSAQVINSLQGVSSRLTDQTQPLVISVCSIHAGSKDNIIPDEALLEGTIRTLDEKTRASAKRHVVRVAKTVCRAFGASCELSFMEDAYPVTVNDPKVTAKVFKVLKTIEGTKTTVYRPVMGGEDFSRFLHQAPGTFYFLGTDNPKKGCIYPNHSSRFKVDEDVLKYGSVSLAALAAEFGAQNL